TSLNASSVLSSRGSRRRTASARQCTHASAQARVTSQITRNGLRVKSAKGGVTLQASHPPADRAYDGRHMRFGRTVLQCGHETLPPLSLRRGGPRARRWSRGLLVEVPRWNRFAHTAVSRHARGPAACRNAGGAREGAATLRRQLHPVPWP